ncbi:hypothetical protein [Streptomyces sp. NPDC055036]
MMLRKINQDTELANALEKKDPEERGFPITFTVAVLTPTVKPAVVATGVWASTAVGK